MFRKCCEIWLQLKKLYIFIVIYFNYNYFNYSQKTNRD